MASMTCSASWHGTRKAYNVAGCRCPDARNAERLYRKRHREGRLPPHYVDSTGTARRLQALAALGWSLQEIATRTGLCFQRIEHLRTKRQQRVARQVAERVEEVYRALCMQIGPSRRTAVRARNRGWAPPLAWDDIDHDPHPWKLVTRDEAIDEVRVERCMAGTVDPHSLTVAEREEAIVRLSMHGLFDGQVAETIGVSIRTVQRVRKRVGLQANQQHGRSA